MQKTPEISFVQSIPVTTDWTFTVYSVPGVKGEEVPKEASRVSPLAMGEPSGASLRSNWYSVGFGVLDGLAHVTLKDVAVLDVVTSCRAVASCGSVARWYSHFKMLCS